MSSWDLDEGRSGVRVSLAEIAIHPGWQVRSTLDREAVRTYRAQLQSGAEFPPIELARLDGVLFVIDGAHRLEAAKQAKLHALPAIIHEGISNNQARWMAASANLKHGVPIQRRDHRNVFQAFIETGQNRKRRGLMSYREIAASLGGIRAYTTIRNWMQKDFPRIAERMEGGLDGTGDPDAGPAWSKGDTLMETVLGLAESLQAVVQGQPKARQRELLRGFNARYKECERLEQETADF